MAVQANDILSYRGDAGAGLVSSGNITDTGVIDSSELSQTAREVALMSFAKNKQLYQQKIEDRDAAFKMLDDEELVLDGVLDQDRPVLEEKTNKVYEIWKKYGGDVYQPQRFQEFKGAIQDAKQHIKQSQKWYTYMKAELDGMSKMTTEYEQTNAKKFLDKQLAAKQGNFFAMPTPFAPTVDFLPDTVQANPEFDPEEVKQDGDFDIVSARVSVDKTLNKYQKLWADPKNTEQFKNFIFGKDGAGGFLYGPNAESDIKRINSGLAKLREQGLMVDDLGVEQNKLTGRYELTTDRVDQLAAKIKLADSGGSISKRVFNKDRATNRLGWANLAADNANKAADRAVDWFRARTDASYKKALAQKAAGLSENDEVTPDVSPVWKTLLQNRKTATFRTNAGKGNAVAVNDVVWAGDLPAGFTRIAGVVPEKDSKGKPTGRDTAGELIPFSTGKGNRTKYFKMLYKNEAGQDVDKNFWTEEYNQSRSNGFKGSYDDFLQYNIMQGGIDVELQGSNGRANILSTIISERALNNKISAGKEQNIFGVTNTDVEDSQ